MTLDIPPTCPAPAEALDNIRARALAADEGRADLSQDISDLRACGLLDALAEPGDPLWQATWLRRIGRASLSVGRLVEGHMNAVALIRLYASCPRKHALLAQCRWALHGVWGAEREDPATIREAFDGRLTLSGTKSFASGLGLVGTAIVTVGGADGTRLALVPASDPSRADISGWAVPGMRATASGTFGLDGLEGEELGRAGDYEREPHFQGGVWRYAALQVGGLEALVEAARQAVRRDPTEARLHRLARLAARTHAARLMVEAAARATAGPRAGEAEVSLALLARESVEEACLTGMGEVERLLGTRAFVEGTEVERVRRDLAFFLRQADLDGKLTRAGQAVCAGGAIGETWGADDALP
ncbi:hypothetical protein [Wenxinia saemankumensis]|uniref:Acyl-CoA dehydrogenase n=1 Tax=Wenxinia saemankumensis TaxID=1447782 RepID=A0A1M6HUA4_9RHOB|nr:hypothetical protein [Wenxinia saemankumensis]SHJ25740.1 Acyl-CoA dehydrogenase [Wenxinia saemankumensis]